MSDCTAKEFCELYGDNMFENIFTAFYAYRENQYRPKPNYQKPFPNISITTMHKQNAINYEAWGYITAMEDGQEVEIEFHIRDGDWAGSELLSFGKSLPEPEVDAVEAGVAPMEFNRVQELGGKFMDKEETYLEYFEANKEKFLQMARDRLYDAHFAPGNVTSKHYSELARENFFQYENTYFRVKI